MWEVRPEEERDSPLVEALVAKVFGPGRYARSAYRLREGVRSVAKLSFVAVEEDALKGSVRFWPVAVGGKESLLLGPLAVQKEERGRGIGLALMQRGIEKAREAGYRTIILVGDAPYYARAGFDVMPEGRIRLPGPVDRTRVLGLALIEGALNSLTGAVQRARIDDPLCADGAAIVPSKAARSQD